ncbi:hypothetical protein RHMOL_Rhmol07G0058700 [Rhododendron molle]|uniref:Uncharacterized protein n=1 Tax=Rhododendron molle TaxID=49168 RepID=A0ACC0MXC4_RHOML|nr:hypothetical protein RHMOL_Rhmol07G0058700 [Rhododendron molle]
MSTDYSYSHPPPPAHLCFLLLILFTFITFSWYTNYESMFEGLFDQIKLILIVSPLILLLAVHLVSSFGSSRGSTFFLPLPERDSLHRAGGTPWGVGFLLVLLFLMISYRSSFQERWFPLLARS